MLDHYVNYPEKTSILTERQPYLRSRPLNSDMYDKEEDNKTPIVVMIVVGWLPYGPTYRFIDPTKSLFLIFDVTQESCSW